MGNSVVTKEMLRDWLNDTDYMEKYSDGVYRDILRHYYDTFFATIYPADRAILAIEKDIGIDIDKARLKKLFYFSYFTRKKAKQKKDSEIEGKKDDKTTVQSTRHVATDEPSSYLEDLKNLEDNPIIPRKKLLNIKPKNQ